MTELRIDFVEKIVNSCVSSAGYLRYFRQWQGQFWKRGSDISLCVKFYYNNIRDRGLTINANIGLDIGMFEEKWSDCLVSIDSRRRDGDDPPFVKNAMNFTELGGRPSIASKTDNLGIEAAIRWTKSILDMADAFPSNKGQLNMVLADRNLFNTPLESWFGHPVKVWAFTIWAESTFGLRFGGIYKCSDINRIYPYSERIVASWQNYVDSL